METGLNAIAQDQPKVKEPLWYVQTTAQCLFVAFNLNVHLKFMKQLVPVIVHHVSLIFTITAHRFNSVQANFVIIQISIYMQINVVKKFTNR